MEEQTFPLQVTCNQKESVGKYRYIRHTQKEAVMRGVKAWLFAMLIAILTILIPLVHFVSVPLGLALSPVVGIVYFLKSRGAPKRVIGDFLCPECQSKNHVETTRIERHYFGHCAHCHNEFKMIPLYQAAKPDE